MSQHETTFPAKIRRWVGESAYQRGRRYVREGRVLAPRRQDAWLKALCQGHAIEPYQVQVRLGGEEGILQARCTCPAGSEGRCKHVAAVLILWHTQPQAFREAPPLREFLTQEDKDTLIALILRMVERHPDLAETIFLWAHEKKRGRDTP